MRPHEEYEKVGRRFVELVREFVKDHNVSIVRVDAGDRDGKSGAKWHLDGIGFDADDKPVLFIECKHYSANTDFKQEHAAALVYRAKDLGIPLAVLVTTKRPQSGALKILNSENLPYAVVPYDRKLDDPNTGMLVWNQIRHVFEEVKLGTASSVAVSGEVIRCRDGA